MKLNNTPESITKTLETIIMRIAIVHKNTNIIRLFKYIIINLELEFCWSCLSSNDAISLCQHDLPDLLLVQLNLDDMNASDLIRHIMATTPTTIIAVSNSIKQNPSDIFNAMSAGALDAIYEPSTDHINSMDDLKNKIFNIKKLHDSLKKTASEDALTSIKNIPLIAIGASTGGPAALLTILQQLPKKTNAVWVIIQHMDHQFSEGMADWLNGQSDISVEIAVNNQRPKVGHVYMAATNDHLIINKTGRFKYTREPVDYPYRPSVDEFFDSAVGHWPNDLIGVLLTGMGRDGANGLLSLYNRGMFTIAQSEESCAVYGMPKAACELNAVSTQLDINDIAPAILKKIR